MPGDSLGTAYAEVVLDQTGFKRGLGQAQTSMIAWNKSMMKYAKIAIGVTGVAALVHQLNSALDASVKFDTALRNVWTLTDATWAEMQKLGEEVANVALQFGATGEEGLKAMYQIYSASFTGRDAMNIFKASLTGAAAGLSDVFTQADLLTTILNAYGMAAEEATHVNDVLFTIIKRGKTTASELGSAFGRLAAVAAPLGASFDDISAALMTLTRQGIATDEAVTAIRNSIVQLARPGKELLALIQSLGYESGTQIISTLGFADALGAVAEAAERNNLPLTDLFTNIRAILAVLPLAGASAAEYAEDLIAAKESAGATSEAFEKQKGKEFELSKAHAELEEATRKLGDALSDLIGLKIGIINFFASLLEGLVKAADAADKLVSKLIDLTGLGGLGILGLGKPSPEEQAYLDKMIEKYRGGPTAPAPAPAPSPSVISDEEMLSFRAAVKAATEANEAGTPVVSALTLAWQALLDEVSDETFNKFWSELLKASPTVEDLIAKVKAFGAEASGNEDVLSRLHDALEDELDRSRDMVDVLRLFGMDTEDAKERVIALAEALGYSEEELASLREELYGAADAVKSFAERLSEGQVGDALTLIDDASKKLGEALASGNWGEIAKAISDLSFLGGSVKAMQDNLERIITGNFDEATKEAAKKLHDQLTQAGEVLGKTFEEIADEEKRAADKALQEKREAARKEADEARKRAEALDQAWQNALNALVTAFVGGDMDAVVENMRRLATSSDPDRVLALYRVLYSTIEDEITLRRLQGKETKDLEDRLKALKIALGDLTEEVKEDTYDLPSSISTWGDAISSFVSIMDEGKADIIGSLTSLATSLISGDISGIASAFAGLVKGIESAAQATVDRIHDVLTSGLKRLVGYLEQGITTVVDWIQRAFRQGIDLSTKALQTLARSAFSAARSFEALIRQTEVYRRLQAAISLVQQAAMNALLAFLWPFVVILEELFGVTTDLGDVLGDEVEERKRLLASLNVPIGWKAERAAYEASIPGQPPIFPEEVTDGGGGPTVELPGWIQGLIDTWGGAIRAALAPLREFIDILQQVGAQLADAIIGGILPALEQFGNDLVDIAIHIRDDLTPIFLEHLPGVIEGFLKSAFNIITAFIAGVVDFFAQIIPGLDDLAQSLAGFTDLFQEFFTDIANAVGPIVNAILEDVADMIDYLTEHAGPIMDAIVAAVSLVTQGLADIIDTLASGIEPLVDLFTELIDRFGEGLSLFLGSIDDAVAHFIETLLTPVNIEALGDILEDFLNILGNVIETVTTFLTDFSAIILPSLADFVDVLSDISDQLPGLASALADALGAVALTLLEDVFTPVGEWIRDTFIPDLETFFGNFGTWWTEKVDPFLESEVLPKIGEALERIYGWLDPILEWLGGPFWDWLSGPAWETVSPYIDEVLGMFEDFGRWVGENWDSISNFLTVWLDRTLSNLEDNLDDFLSATENWLLYGNPIAIALEDLRDAFNRLWDALSPIIAPVVIGAIEALAIAFEALSIVMEGFEATVRLIANAFIAAGNAMILIHNMFSANDWDYIPYLQTRGRDFWQVEQGGLAVVHKGEIVGRPPAVIAGEGYTASMGARSNEPIQLQVFLDGQQIYAAVRQRNRMGNLDSGFALEGIG